MSFEWEITCLKGFKKNIALLLWHLLYLNFFILKIPLTVCKILRNNDNSERDKPFSSNLFQLTGTSLFRGKNTKPQQNNPKPAHSQGSKLDLAHTACTRYCYAVYFCRGLTSSTDTLLFPLILLGGGRCCQSNGWAVLTYTFCPPPSHSNSCRSPRQQKVQYVDALMKSERLRTVISVVAWE